jgi:hypothetical protein
VYRVRFRGSLDATWFSSLQDVSLSSAEVDGVQESTLNGSATDDAALMGVLNLLHDLGCTLVSVELLDSEAAHMQDEQAHIEASDKEDDTSTST